MKNRKIKNWILCLLVIGLFGTQFSYASASFSIDAFSQKNISVGAAPVLQVKNEFGGTVVHWKKLQRAEGYYVYRKENNERTWKKMKIVKLHAPLAGHAL